MRAGVKPISSDDKLHADLPFSALMSLTEPAGFDWGSIRAAQFAHAGSSFRSRLVWALAVATLAIMLLVPTVPFSHLAGWMAAVTIISYLAYRYRTSRAALCASTLPRSTVFVDVAFTAAFGSLWAFMLGYFGPIAGHEVAVSLVVLASAVMCGQISILSSLPASNMTLLTLTGLGIAAMLARLDHLIGAVFSAIYAWTCIAVALQVARDFIRFKTTENTLFDKSETVSLLLREFEDDDSDWLWQIDSARRLVHVSPRFASSFGCDSGELEGASLVQVLAGDKWEDGDLPPALHELAGKIQRRESFSNLMLPIHVGDTIRWWELSASPRRDDEGQFVGFRGVGSDVTLQQQSAAKIDRLARYDVLTSLPNRLHLNEALGRAIDHAHRWKSRCAFMMIDLDRFKAINDSLGHQIGDALLVQVGARLTALMNENTMCGRLGGDEFGVVVREAEDNAMLDRLARQIIATISKPYQVEHHTLYVGASIGSAIGLRDGRTMETLTRSADLALYRSKDKGGGCHYGYEPSLHAQAEERRVMEIALRHALERGEFHLNYQPVVRAEDGVIQGFEALIRWVNKDLGPVSPVKFIPIAEDTRLIGAIGEWVLRTACHEAVKWPDHIRVAVNVSAEQLFQPNFVNSVVSALSHSGLPASRLELEVTESVFINDVGVCHATLDQLIALGIALSLDDFGTGYSSLGYLRKTQFSTIKIDRMFVQGAAKQAPESLAIIRAVVALADSLGMSTTAEGAETEAEVEMICQLGCKKIQGFYFGRPMSKEDALALFLVPETQLPVAAAARKAG